MTDSKDTKDIDALSGVETTGHEWDGLKELNNPAPRWWLWVFYITVIWAVGYWVVYPAWPTLSGNTQGMKGWSQYSKLKKDQQEIVARKTSFLEHFEGKTLDQIRHDPKLFEFAVAGGAATFKDNCATCHGTGGAGGPGYPNLNDDDWLWGGSLEEIYTTLKYGVRSGHTQAHDSMMPAFGKDGILTKEQIAALTEYVLTLSGTPDSTSDAGKLFAENCASCHGKDGEGSKEFGAPTLNDALWFYGGDKTSIARQIRTPRHGVMPYWDGRLSEDTIKQLSIYVHSLGGGE